MANSEDFWRKAINSLSVPFPEVGHDPPPNEEIDTEQELVTEGEIDPKNEFGNFSRVTLNIYFFMNHETGKYYLMQAQDMWDYGDMSLEKASGIVRKKHGRKKG